MTSAFNESTFQSKVDETLRVVKTVLDTTKNPAVSRSSPVARIFHF